MFTISVYVGGSLSSQPMIGEQVLNLFRNSYLCGERSCKASVFAAWKQAYKHKARLRFVFYKYGSEQVFEWIRNAYKDLIQEIGVVSAPLNLHYSNFE
jgi:sulfite reductase beta subunit-like hemoprotein